MVEQGISRVTCDAIYRYAKANNKCVKDIDKNSESLYSKYWDLNNLYCYQMSQKLPVKDCRWMKNISKFDRSFIKNYNEESNEGYFLEVDIQHPKNLH